MTTIVDEPPDVFRVLVRTTEGGLDDIDCSVRLLESGKEETTTPGGTVVDVLNEPPIELAVDISGTPKDGDSDDASRGDAGSSQTLDL